MKEIMRRVGVRDKSHFAHDFKLAYGFSPTRYRERYLSGALQLESQIRQQTVKSANK